MAVAPMDPTLDDDAMRTGVATAYSFAGTVSALAVGGWLLASVLRGHWVRVAGEGFFEASAQVLPVLLLTFAVERVFFERDTSRLASRASSIAAFVTVLGLTGVGELLSFLAVAWNGGPPDGLRIAGGVVVITATAGSIALIVGFAALRSGVLLDVRAGLKIIVKGTPDEFDPRASSAAAAGALVLSLMAALGGNIVLVAAVVIGVTENEGDADYEQILIAIGVLVFLVLVPVSTLHLARVLLRNRRRRRWLAAMPDEAVLFLELSPSRAGLPPAAQRVVDGRFVALVDAGRAVSGWPDDLLQAAVDDRLTLSERAAIRGFEDGWRTAARLVADMVAAAQPSTSPRS
jgi:hypothetical protein